MNPMTMLLPFLASQLCHLTVGCFTCHETLCSELYKLTNMPTYCCSCHVWICIITCYVYMGAIISSDPFWLLVSKGLLFYEISIFMPCLFFAMVCSCSMLFDSSKLSNLMLFLPCPVISAKSVKLLLFAILPCVFEHVLVISGDSSVFMFCYALPVHHAHAFCSYVGVL